MRRFLTELYARTLIRVKYRKGFSVCDKALALGRKMMAERNKGMVWDHTNHFSKVIIFVLAQNIHRLQSVRALCAKGLAKDAIPLIRCMFEDFADVQYMFLNKDTVKDFIDYGTYLQLQSARGLMESSANIDKAAIKDKMESLEKGWETMKSRFLRPDGKVHNRWNKKSSESMVEAALYVGAGTFIDLLGIANEEHQMGYKEELEIFTKFLQKNPTK